MTPGEFRAARKRLGWVIHKAAHELGVDASTIVRYNSGDLIVPKTVVVLMETKATVKSDGSENDAPTMSSGEFWDALRRLGWSEDDAARELGRHRTMIFKYQTGVISVPKIINILLRLKLKKLEQV